MKIEHFLVVVVIFCITIFLVIVLAGPPKKHIREILCNLDEKPDLPNCECVEGKWQCDWEILCNPNEKPNCDIGTNLPKCIDGKWQCDFYLVEPSIITENSSENCYPYIIGTSISSGSLQNSEQTCKDMGDDCILLAHNSSGGWAQYMPLGDKNNSSTVGFRLTPYSENIFKRIKGYKMSDTPTQSYNNTNSIKDCENNCINTAACKDSAQYCNCMSGGFGYDYDSSTKICNVYTTNKTSGTYKYLKNTIKS